MGRAKKEETENLEEKEVNKKTTSSTKKKIEKSEATVEEKTTKEEKAEETTKKKKKKEIKRIDKLRANHYKYYTEKEWKDYSNYDICINSDTFGVEKAAEIICESLKNKNIVNM